MLLIFHHTLAVAKCLWDLCSWHHCLSIALGPGLINQNIPSPRQRLVQRWAHDPNWAYQICAWIFVRFVKKTVLEDYLNAIKSAKPGAAHLSYCQDPNIQKIAGRWRDMTTTISSKHLNPRLLSLHELTHHTYPFFHLSLLCLNWSELGLSFCHCN